jgi:MFS family permease
VKRRDGNLLQLSSLLGSAGNSGVHIALPWLVLETTGSSAKAGIVLAITGFSVILTAPIIGGTIAVLGAKRVSMWADVISATSVLLFPLLDATVGLSTLAMLAVGIYGAMFDPAGSTARKSMIQRIADDEGRELTRFNGSFEAWSIVGTIVGMAGAALLIGAMGVHSTFLVLAGAFVASLAAMSTLRISRDESRGQQRFTAGNVLGETRTGMGVLWRDKPLLSLVGLYTMLSALYMPVESIVLARHFNDLDQPHVLGMILSAMSLGTVIGAFQFHRIIGHVQPARVVVASMTGIGLVVCAMALLPGAAAFVALGLALGLSFGPASPLSNYLVQRRVPERLHGPVFGTMFSSTHVAIPVGTLGLGLIIESVSIPLTLLVIGASFITVTVVVGVFGPMRHLDAGQGPGSPSV